ncbi:sulfite exporter TauE/SafE family protein 5 isoform X2 [Ricinus communis]|uniref:Uncharacterized protein n=1 Tax=Ricinus communis TaxID=3988 RepID=B9RXU8_RICCO|nr:sulfite exporter TauE/SafE family protein 5 isoform X2 [Ricinus communis]EEF43954.1 conserved hypothetical protein [Ricinus communis]|eukprot:XP_002518567.1 sulfite exporter TauE/SafE family protein 5 isoform X2 [Ricinus communis]
MATLNNLAFTLSLTVLISFYRSNAEQTQSIARFLETDQYLNETGHWRNYLIQSQEPMLKLASPMVLSGVLCFIAASISSAGGIGGGGLFVPILTIVAGLDLKTASSFSAFMVTGGSIANVLCNLFSPKFGGKALIDYDIALLSEPCMLLGVSVGVICNLIFPEWLITVLFVLFLVWSTFKTCKNAVAHWNLESEEVKRNGHGNLENGRVKDRSSIGNEEIKIIKEPLMGIEMENRMSFTWEKLGVLVLIWLSFSFLYLLRGNRYGEGIAPLKPCGVGYWVVSSLQIPLAIIFTAWILLKKRHYQNQTANLQDIDDSMEGRAPNKLTFPIMALLAGILGGVFGIGGGMLISPLLLHVGIPPEVTAATCSFMVFFSSTMSAFQYLLSGMEHTDTALMFASICFVASLVGLLVVQRIIQDYGRASIIVFSVSIVMALSTVLITSFGTIDVWRNYESGTNMGFKLPC